MLFERARRLRRRGEPRKAIVALREACLRDDRAAWAWTLYGAWLGELGRTSDAEAALGHALWLRKRAGDEPRARVTERLLARLRHAA
jgi:Flp pilus assembly protein TadD